MLAKSAKTSAKGAKVFARKLIYVIMNISMYDNMTTSNYKEPPEYLDKIGNKIVDAAFQVHKRWGPGLLEHFYQKALCAELKKYGFDVQSEVYLPVELDETTVNEAYKIDPSC